MLIIKPLFRKALQQMKKQMYFNDMIFLSHGNKIIIKDKEGSKGMKYLTISELGKINYFNLYNRALDMDT